MSAVAVADAPATSSFVLPPERSATEPPEARGLARDEVRLLVATSERLDHALFRDLGRFLRFGDVLVVNTSATVPAALDGVREDGRRVVVHAAARLAEAWIVELRRPDGSGPTLDGRTGEWIALPEGAGLVLVGPYLGSASNRLWLARVQAGGAEGALLARWGRPISYGYVRGRWPLAAYQTVFAREPGSAEMPSAARPFSQRLVTELVSAGVLFAPVLLHAGVSSLEAAEAPPPERFAVSEHTASLVNHARDRGGRVIAVGTTSTRAVESVAAPDGAVSAGEGWTDLVLGPDRPARAVDGLVTGWHDPGASHLGLLEAVAGRDLVAGATEAALEAGYLWHEFGDSCLFLPARAARSRG